jgi:hypothetical protein
MPSVQRAGGTTNFDSISARELVYTDPKTSQMVTAQNPTLVTGNMFGVTQQAEPTP